MNPLRALFAYPARWIVPTLIVTGLAIVYACYRQDTWKASQAMIVRSEGAGSLAQGTFQNGEAIKSTQETIQELATSREVITRALTKVGPPPRYNSAKGIWPSPAAIDDLRSAVTVAPPKGAMFGRTEVFYLTVKDSDRDRAGALVDAVCLEVDQRFKELRVARTQSVVQELEKTAAVAKLDLEEASKRLADMEKSIGSDLPELRSLSEATAGGGDVQRKLNEMDTETRTAQANLEGNQALLALLRDAQKDKSRLLASPNRLLESQPALKSLKTGLVEAQLATAKLQGQMTSDHPLVAAAKASEREVESRLSAELEVAIRGVEAEVELATKRIADLANRGSMVKSRIDRLAGMRVAYSNLVADSRQKMQVSEKAHRELSDAKASLVSALNTSLVSRLDDSEVGVRPVGPGRTMVVAAGAAAGLMLGLAILLLTTPGGGAVPAASLPGPTSNPDAMEPEAERVFYKRVTRTDGQRRVVAAHAPEGTRRRRAEVTEEL